MCREFMPGVRSFWCVPDKREGTGLIAVVAEVHAVDL